VFEATTNSYTVTFKNGEDVLQTGKVAYGVVPEYKGDEPTKAATAQYTYTFAGWNPSISAVTGEVTYTATFTETVNKYTITWVVDGETVKTETLAYGEAIVAPTIELPANDAQYTYTTAGFGAVDATVTGDKTYSATIEKTVNKYTVTWNIEGETTTETYEYGATPSYKGETPTKEGDAQYSYTFKDWGTIVEVTGAATYTATFTRTVNKYTVTWVIDGKETEEEYEYGATPAHADPEKAADAEYTYTFKGWTPAIAAVTGDATYTAEFTATPIPTEPEPLVIDLSMISGSKTDTAGHTYIILMQNSVAYVNLGKIDLSQYEIVQIRVAGANSVFNGYHNCPIGLSNSDAAIGTYNDWNYIYEGATGENQDASSLFTYELLTGMSTLDYEGSRVITLDISQNKGEEDADVYLKTVSAGSVQLHVYEIVLLPKNCVSTVTWKNEDGSILKTEKVANGDTPVYTGTTPTKAHDAEYTYTFTGWTPAIEAVTGDVTYTAEFTATPIVTEPAFDGTWIPAEGTNPGTATAPLQLYEAVDWSEYGSVTVWVYHITNTNTSWPGKNVWINLYKEGEDGKFVPLFGTVYLPRGDAEGQPLDTMEDGEKAIPVTFELGNLLDGYTGALYLATVDNTYLEVHKVTFNEKPPFDGIWTPAENTNPGTADAPLQLHEALDWSQYESVTVWVYHITNTTTSWPAKNVWINLYKEGEDGKFVPLFGTVYLPLGKVDGQPVEGQPLDTMEDGEQAIPVTFELGDLLDGYTGALYLATMDNTWLECHKVTFTAKNS